MSSLTTSSPSNQIFSDAELEVWKSLTTAETPATVAIPEDLSAENVWLYLNVVVKGLSRAQQAVSRLKPFLGRLLLLVRKHPHLYEQQGYANFSEFITNGVPALFGVSRPEAWNCIRVSEVLDFLPAQQMEKMGFSRLNVLAAVLKKEIPDGMSMEMVEKKRGYWVAAAESNITVKEFQQKVETEMQLPKGDLSIVALTLYCSEDVRKRWQDFVKMPEVQSICDSESEGVILSRLLDECELEWVTKAHDAERS